MTIEQAYDRLDELENRKGLTLDEMQELTALRYDIRFTCECGEVGAAEERYDARGIYLMRCCDKCWKDKRKGYRPEVLTDPGYWANEQIEEGY